ncbi:MAG TPA: hypothetical protein VMW27_12170, partial [Thermoanaerobaculia bacterium]|nr:hypothetical protein [Thermoanaerobaculia bacterium]
MPPTMNTFAMTVTFTPANIPLGLDPISFAGPDLIIPQGLSFITFTLETVPEAADKAMFQTSPIQWLHVDYPYNPVIPPSMFIV